MGLTWSSPLETYVTVTCFLHSNFGHLAQPNQAPFLWLDYLLKTIFVQDPFFLRTSNQLNPTDFAFFKTLLHSFSNSSKKLYGLVKIYCFSTSFRAFSPLLDLTTYLYISLLGMLGSFCL